jgi:hypothetical protein
MSSLSSRVIKLLALIQYSPSVIARDQNSKDEGKFSFVRFEVFKAVTMKNAVFWDVTPCGSCKNRRFGGSQRLHQQDDKNGWTKNKVSCN